MVALVWPGVGLCCSKAVDASFMGDSRKDGAVERGYQACQPTGAGRLFGHVDGLTHRHVASKSQSGGK